MLAQQGQGSSQPKGKVAGDARAVIEPYTCIAWSYPGQVGILTGNAHMPLVPGCYPTNTQCASCLRSLMLLRLAAVAWCSPSARPRAASSPMMPAQQNKCGARVHFQTGALEVSHVCLCDNGNAGRFLSMCLHACSGAIHGLSFAQLASGPAFVALGGQHSIVQLSAASGAIQDSWEAGKHPLSAMAMSHDGSQCVLAGALVDVWGPATQARVLRFSGHAVRHIYCVHTKS